jgi:DNA-binding CsgD family transcriptional regulator
MLTKIPEKYAVVCMAGADDSFHGALVYVFEKELCSKCVALKNDESVPTQEIHKNADRSLVLIDSMERDFEKDMISLGLSEGSQGGNITVALFNIQKGTGIETLAFIRGIKGFFFWISRDILVRIAMESRGRKVHTISETTGFNHREVETLALVSIGSSNNEIADKLFISLNTAKAHLYRVFQKIKVPNRFQAALWEAKNL